MTCTTCGEPAEAGPLCRDCAEERAAHRTAKARHRAELLRRREKRTDA
jgi:hypothetical protein